MGQYQGEDYISDYGGPEIDKGIGNALTPDAAPTAGSTKLVTSGGVYTAIQNIPTGVTSFYGRTGAVSPAAGDYDAAMVGATPVIGKGVNLLVNWYFPNPINQRGVSGTVSATGYFVDRWILKSGSVQLTSAGLVLNGEIEQRLEFAPPSIRMLSVFTPSGTAAISYGTYTESGTTIYAVTISSSGGTIVAAKLEVGTTQTLHNGSSLLDAPPIFQQELAKCQRYYWQITPEEYAGFAMGYVNTPTQVLGILNYPVPMRIVPDIAYTGDVFFSSREVDYYTLTLNTSWVTESSLVFNCNRNDISMPVGNTGFIRGTNNTKITASADL